MRHVLTGSYSLVLIFDRKLQMWTITFLLVILTLHTDAIMIIKPCLCCAILMDNEWRHRLKSTLSRGQIHGVSVVTLQCEKYSTEKIDAHYACYNGLFKKTLTIKRTKRLGSIRQWQVVFNNRCLVNKQAAKPTLQLRTMMCLCKKTRHIKYTLAHKRLFWIQFLIFYSTSEFFKGIVLGEFLACIDLRQSRGNILKQDKYPDHRTRIKQEQLKWLDWNYCQI